VCATFSIEERMFGATTIHDLKENGRNINVTQHNRRGNNC